MTASELDVFVVQVGPTGLWEADCFNQVCGYGLHTVSEDNPTQEAAERAATVHRAEIRKQLAEKAERARQVEQGTAAYWQDIALQRERETERVERDLETANATIARVRALAARLGVTDPGLQDEILAALDQPQEPTP